MIPENIDLQENFQSPNICFGRAHRVLPDGTNTLVWNFYVGEQVRNFILEIFLIDGVVMGWQSVNIIQCDDKIQWQITLDGKFWNSLYSTVINSRSVKRLFKNSFWPMGSRRTTELDADWLIEWWRRLHILQRILIEDEISTQLRSHSSEIPGTNSQRSAVKILWTEDFKWTWPVNIE